MKAAEKSELNVIVESATPRDAATIRRIQAEGWLSTYPNEAAGVGVDDVRDHIEGLDGELIPEKTARLVKMIKTAGPTHAVFVARVGGVVVGFASPYIDEGTHNFGGLYVDSRYRGRGIATRLVQAVLEWHGPHDVHLGVMTYNQHARDVYKHLGFVERGMVKPGFVLKNGTIMPEVHMVHVGKKKS